MIIVKDLIQIRVNQAWLSLHQYLNFNSPDGLWSYRLGFDSELGLTNDFKIGIYSFPTWRSSIKAAAWRTSRQVY